MSVIAPRRLGRIALSTLCATLALAAAACSPSDGAGRDTKGAPATSTKAKEGAFPGLSGPQIANKAFKATKTATSLTVDFAARTTDGNMKAYMSIDSKGDCKGTLSPGGTGTAELIRVGDNAYMRFDEAFLRSQDEGGSAEETAAVLKILKGRWVKSDASSPDDKEQLEFCELKTFLGQFKEGFNLMRRGEETTVNGRKVLTLTEKDGDTSYKVYVATEGEPYVLKVEQKGGEEPGTITFSAFNKPVGAAKPAAKDIVDLDEEGAAQ
ncbi:hypothetical protein FBY35_6575 [Streptomyces sp. SLBN-118]|uniref:hypothetical protein n=1 Tax=Streptomyces sp. SLBN-118 TaxID=2768454 RepID=UPI001153855D|nr:hypothetical protein [Streptomyces sp. SLBN-118]TQK45036.1 hypothetical protein FBY35_6575 [Streptomyces sp. SLBN-118]